MRPVRLSHLRPQCARALARARLRIRAEAGFTLIELLAATVVLAIGIAALTTMLISSRELVNASERRAAASHVAEETLEDVATMRYADVGLTSLPSTSGDPYDPDYYVSGDTYRPDQRGGGSAEQLVDGGNIDPSSPWSDGRLSGTVHTYVTETSVGPAEPVRRVTVAVTVDGGKRIKPVVSSLVISP